MKLFLLYLLSLHSLFAFEDDLILKCGVSPNILNFAERGSHYVIYETSDLVSRPITYRPVVAEAVSKNPCKLKLTSKADKKEFEFTIDIKTKTAEVTSSRHSNMNIEQRKCVLKGSFEKYFNKCSVKKLEEKPLVQEVCNFVYDPKLVKASDINLKTSQRNNKVCVVEIACANEKVLDSVQDGQFDRVIHACPTDSKSQCNITPEECKNSKVVIDVIDTSIGHETLYLEYRAIRSKNMGIR